MHDRKIGVCTGSLLYLTAIRLDILFAVCICARFQDNLKESHIYALKRNFAYLKDSHDCGLFYSKNSDLFLKAYNCTSGACQFL